MRQFLTSDEMEMKRGDKPINFYDNKSISGWIRFDENDMKDRLNDSQQNTYGIYMLFDSQKKHLYIGKAQKIYTRMLQHREKLDDPIPQFDYYRYSLIDKSYCKETFLIENAGIHDLAMLFSMPNGNTYKTKALNQQDFLGDCCIKDIMLVNSVETQTKWDDM